MKMLVTGGAGFIGSNLVDQLILENNEVHVIDNFSSGKKENCNDKAIYHQLDISNVDNVDALKKIFNDVDTIFHCAALARVQPSIIDPLKYEINNTLGIMNVSSLLLVLMLEGYLQHHLLLMDLLIIYLQKRMILLIQFRHMLIKNTMVSYVAKCFQKFMVSKLCH